MSDETSPKYWTKTRLNNLVRHANGRYYARLYRDGKEIWKSLKTSHLGIAEGKLAKLQKEHRAVRGKDLDHGSAKMTFGQAATLHLQRINQSVVLKRRTKAYWGEILAAVLKSWPSLSGKEIRRITGEQCRAWAADYAPLFSGTRYNNSIALVRHVFDLAIKTSVIYSNPAEGLERVKVKSKVPVLPTRAKFTEFIAEMRRGRSRDSKNCADLAEGLAYTGMRVGESWEVTRSDVRLVTGEITISGDPEEATKNGEVRFVPLTAEARALFGRMLAERPDEGEKDKLFRVRECQKSMDRAAKKVGMVRITHHDLRHLFATICIESGVDIPTVSRWLGHRDGGVLAMKTYGHLRREHSIQQMHRVSFSATT